MEFNIFESTSGTLSDKQHKLAQIKEDEGLGEINYVEISKGYEFIFPYTDNILQWIHDFVQSEQQCCGFLDFTIDEQSDQIHLILEASKGNISAIKAWIREIMFPVLLG